MPATSSETAGRYEYADGLLLPPGSVTAPRLDWRVVVGLLLMCLIPRAFIAWHEDELVPDATFYFQVADHLDAGDLQAAFYNLHLNVYPMILVGLRRLGLDYETAGEWWGVLMGTLTVLPLYGLVRRQFDERVAIAAGFLYAFHPPLAQWSREIVREPTFWFCFTLALYASWRAMMDVRWRSFVLAGAAITLAIYVRSEAWLLLICVGLWWCWRWLALREARWKLTWCACSGLAVLPLILLIVNVTWLHDYPEWELGRFRHFGVVGKWLMAPGESAAIPRMDPAIDDTTMIQSPPTEVVRTIGIPVRHAGLLPTTFLAGLARTDSLPHLVASATKFSQPVLLRKFCTRLVKAFDLVFGLLFLIGLAVGRKASRRRQQTAYLAMNLSLLLGVWTYMVRSQEINLRYFFPVVIASTPYAAIGLLALHDAVGKWLQARSNLIGRRWLAPAGLMLAVVSACFIGLLTDRLHSRRDQHELGQWVHRQWGPHHSVVGSAWAALFTYHAQADYLAVPIDDSDEAFLQCIAARRPRIAIVWSAPAHGITSIPDSDLSESLSLMGYRLVPAQHLPPSCRETARVFLPTEDVQRIAARNGRTPAGGLRR